MFWTFTVPYVYEPRHDKTNKLAVRPAKTQISPGIRPVWSESSLSAWRKLGSLATHWAHGEDSDQTGRMPRLIWIWTGRTVTLLVLTCRGSYTCNMVRKHLTPWYLSFVYTLLHVNLTFRPLYQNSENIWAHFGNFGLFQLLTLSEPRHERTCLRGFRPGKTQTSLLCDRDQLESWNLGFSKYRYCTIFAVNNKGAYQTVRMRRLICVFDV